MILIIGSSIQSLCTLSKKFVKMQNFNQFLLMGWSERNALLTFQEQIRQLMKFNFSQFFFFFLLDYAPHCILQLQLTERDIVYTVNYTVYSTLVLEILEIYCTGHTYLRQVNYRETKLLKPTDKVILYSVYHKYSLNTTGSPLCIILYSTFVHYAQYILYITHCTVRILTQRLQSLQICTTKFSLERWFSPLCRFLNFKF